MFDDCIFINGLVIRSYYFISYKLLEDSILLIYEFREKPPENLIDKILYAMSKHDVPYYRYKLKFMKTEESEKMIKLLETHYDIKEYSDTARPIQSIKDIGFYSSYSILKKYNLPLL